MGQVPGDYFKLVSPKENKIAEAILIYFACPRIACDLDAGTVLFSKAVQFTFARSDL